jgi:uncharacterized protein
MSTASASVTQPGGTIRPPGVYLEDRVPLGAGTTELMTGVPAFVGFADPDPNALERGRGRAVVVDRWDANAFERSIRPAGDSFLHMAVRGFFANGGRRCVVSAVPPGSGVAGILRTLRRGGPLDERSDIDLICLPDATSQSVQDREDRYEVQSAALAHCEAMGDRFAVLDAQEVSSDGDLVNEVLGKASRLRSQFGALYFPWIASDLARDGLTMAPPRPGSQEWRCLSRSKRIDDHGPLQFGPPCGHVAGVFARIDGLVGPQRSPANVGLDDVVGTSTHLDDVQHARINEGGVNCLRAQAGQGVVVGGARTRSGHSAWAYVSTARVILGFRRWLAVGLRDLVFEPHSPALWDRIRIRLWSKCLELQRSGALAGTDPAEAFFVKCDAELNRPEEIDLGKVVALVGLAPSVPAEFIVVRIERDPGGVTVSGMST